MRSVSMIALVLGVSLCGGAQAQVFRGPCHVDTLCPGVERGGGKIIACLKTHKSELTEQCYAAIGRFMINRNGGGGGKRGGGGTGGGGGGPGGGGGGGPAEDQGAPDADGPGPGDQGGPPPK